MTRRRLSILLILAMVLVTAVGVFLIRAVQEPQNSKPARVPVPVEVARITPQDFTHRLEALGTVQAIREAAVSVKVSGPVTAIPPEIELGAAVKQGTLLATIDPTPFRIDVSQRKALVARARAQVRTRQAEIARQKALIRINRDKLRLAQAEFDRLKSLFDQGGIAWVEVKAVELALRRTQEEAERAKSGLREAEAEHAVAEAELASAQAELSRAQDALADTQVEAPFAGIISEKPVTLGEQVAPGTVLFRLADISTVKVLIRIPADDVGFLHPGAKAEVTLTGFTEPFQGRVEHIGPRADPETRTFPVEVLVGNPGPRRLLPGMFAHATIPVRSYPQAILIPRASVVTEDGSPAVFVAGAKQEIAQRRPVTIARTFGSRHLITRGLETGDLLVVTGHRLLRDGAAIRVVETRELTP
ncbi:MAG: efflux RND transporter periplasmic adaptor subunit [Candidatus Methylomirabilales bacterium]